METEQILTGYCRALDQSRMVIAVLADGRLTEIDCDYPSCPHIQSCPIAQQLPTEYTHKPPCPTGQSGFFHPPTC